MPDRVAGRIAWRVNRRIRPAVWAGAGIGALAASAILLWAHYGSVVFFEMMAAGFASCF